MKLLKPRQTYRRKKPRCSVVAALLAAALLTGCTPPNEAPPASEQDAAPLPTQTPAEPAATGFVTLTREDASLWGCGGDQGFYEIRYDEATGNKILYVDYQTAREIYLCADPNCTHDQENCTAWLDPDEGGYLPLVSGEHLLLVHITYGAEAPERAIPHIEAANLDGSDRHTLVEFAANERLSRTFAANGSQLICALNEVSSDGQQGIGATFKLVSIDLDTGARTDFYTCPVQLNGTEPAFLGVTENGCCVLRQKIQTKSEADFPGQDWADIHEEIERSAQYTCTVVPVGSSQPVGTVTYSGRVYDLLTEAGLFYLDLDTRTLTRITLPNGLATELSTLPDVGATSFWLDGQMGDWFLLSQGQSQQNEAGTSWRVTDSCYAVQVQTGERRELTIRQQSGADLLLCTMLGKNAADVLLVTGNHATPGAGPQQAEWSLINQQAYLDSDADALRPVQLLP